MNKKRVILIVLVFLVILLTTAISFFNYSKITGKVIAENNLIAYYKFEDNALDSSGNGNNGVLIGNVYFTEDGISGKALKISGNTDYVKINPVKGFDKSASISFWIKPEESSNRSRPYASDYWGTMYYNAREKRLVWFTKYDTNSLPHGAVNDFIDYGQWQMITVTNDGNISKLYKNGELVNSFKSSGNQGNMNYNFSIGSGYFKGLIDEFKIYNRALTENEIKGEYKNYKPEKQKVILADYRGEVTKSSYIKISAIESLGTSDSVSFWIKPENSSGRSRPYTYSSRWGTMYYEARGKKLVWFTRYDKNSKPHSSVNDFIDYGQWQMITVTNDGETSKLYKNGELVNSFKSLDVGQNYAPLSLSIGDTLFKGLIDEFKIYNRALTDSEIKQIYGKKDVRNNLAGEWKFEEDSGKYVYDSSTYKNNGFIYDNLGDTDSIIRLKSGCISGGCLKIEKKEEDYGKIDIPLTINRLKDASINTYAFLVYRDSWKDFQIFLDEANKSNIDVYVYLLNPPRCETYSSLPYKCNFTEWATAIATLSLKYPNLKAWVIDDFMDGKRISKEEIADFTSAAKSINPKLKFYPIIYNMDFSFSRTESFPEYAKFFDGIIFPFFSDFPQRNHESVKELNPQITLFNSLNDGKLTTLKVSYPSSTPSEISDNIEFTSKVYLNQNKNFSFAISKHIFSLGGYHFAQLLLDNQIIWEKDLAELNNSKQGFPEILKTFDLSKYTTKESAVVTLRIIEKKSVSNYPVEFSFYVPSENLGLWEITKKGNFSGEIIKNEPLGLSLIVMVYATGLDAVRESVQPEYVRDATKIALERIKAGDADGVMQYVLDKEDISTGSKYYYVKELYSSFVCNNNGVCESDSGETTENCPSDCPKVIICNNNGICEQRLGETRESCPGDCPEFKTCSDGTVYNQCSANKPVFCSNGILINNCSVCGCSDNKICSEDGECILSECSQNSDCNDNLFCTTDACVNGRCENRNNILDCNDNNPCTIQDKCSQGQCSGNSKNCNDNKICTIDSCNALNGNCLNIFDSSINNCECNSNLNCNDNIACTIDLCKNNKCEHNLNNSACDDNIYCNGQETCSLTRGCVSGTSVNCDDNNAGTYDLCNETSRRCEHIAIIIDSDNDGVPDERDKCPTTPLLLVSKVNKHGCVKPLADKFDIKSDFENEDILNLVGLKIGISGKGKIVFSENVSLSRIKGNNEEQIDLDSHINISQNKIEINSSALPELNKSVKITMYNISLVNPRVFRDNYLCSECIILNWSSNIGLFEFNVSHFSVYALEETPYCGDGYCNEGEICSSCSVDCGTCPDGDGGSVRCSILNWTCSNWSSCSIGNKTRECVSNCNTRKTDKESCLVSSFTENITVQEEVSKIQEDKSNKRFIFIILLICLIVIVLVWLIVSFVRNREREQNLEKIIEPRKFV